jgi:hypothetical protein
MTVWGIAVLVLQLNATDFDDNVVCLGPQVASVLEALIALPELSKAAWYAASVDAIGSPEVRAAFRSYEPREPRPIGDMATFVSLVLRAVQFLDGVFFAVPVGQAPDVTAKFLTSDGPIERLVANSIVEVCAADTSLIWISTDISSIIDRLPVRFGSKTQLAANE